MSELNLETARQIIQTTFEYGSKNNIKPLAVLVLDSGGHPLAFERQDGASAGRFAIANGKAYGAIMLGIGSRSLMSRAEHQSYFVLAANGAFDGRVIPMPGGVLIRDENNNLLGAVGASGDTADNDEAALLASIHSVGLVADPGE